MPNKEQRLVVRIESFEGLVCKGWEFMRGNKNFLMMVCCSLLMINWSFWLDVTFVKITCNTGRIKSRVLMVSTNHLLVPQNEHLNDTILHHSKDATQAVSFVYSINLCSVASFRDIVGVMTVFILLPNPMVSRTKKLFVTVEKVSLYDWALIKVIEHVAAAL